MTAPLSSAPRKTSADASGADFCVSKATSENVETLLALCEQGVGACFCPENLLHTALSPAQLAHLHILPLCPEASYPICFGYLSRSYPWSVLSEFIRIAREQTA